MAHLRQRRRRRRLSRWQLMFQRRRWWRPGQRRDRRSSQGAGCPLRAAGSCRRRRWRRRRGRRRGCVWGCNRLPFDKDPSWSSLVVETGLQAPVSQHARKRRCAACLAGAHIHSATQGVDRCHCHAHECEAYRRVASIQLEHTVTLTAGCLLMDTALLRHAPAPRAAPVASADRAKATIRNGACATDRAMPDALLVRLLKC